MEFRKLKQSEIDTLKQNACNADNWNNINVVQDFSPEFISHTNFNGNIFLGKDVRIQNVKLLSNYNIESDVKLENIAYLFVEGNSSFANGNKISVLNEGGGRELVIYDKLSAQIAYILVTCRHDTELVNSIESILFDYSESKKNSIGKIGSGSQIINCGTIKNVWIDECAHLEGVSCLSEGTIASSKHDPVSIGINVNAKHFIIQSGSSITDGALIDNCFIGQGVKIGKQFSAENCAFFSNCEAYHGEAVSVFAGPYTVTHHKSTLLIAAMFSFYNAGSGTNQSNHMYKLGPLHQGILERGSKTGSFSYMLWPSRVGAFSVVIGKHYSNFDSSEFPFSYINEEDGKSVLTPAMNLFTVGTRRDSEKWPGRDRRKDPEKFDLLNFDLLNPYTVGKMLDGSVIMKDLLEKAKRDQEYVSYNGLFIKRLLLKTCAKYYEMAIKIFIGQEVIKRISDENDFDKIKLALEYKSDLYDQKWIDAGGMLASKKDYELLLDSILKKEIDELNKLNLGIKNISDSYSESSWTWTAKLIESRFNCKIADLTKAQLIQIINNWKDNSIKLNNMILKDAEKEFDQVSKIGFGLDGNDEIKDKDFENVRGKFEDNKFVIQLRRESETVAEKAQNLISKIN